MPTLAIGVDARKATVGAREASRAISKIRKETAMLEKQQKLLAGQMVKTGAAGKTMGAGMGRMFTGLMALGAVVKVIKTWGNLDEAMRRVQGVVRGTDEQMKLLEHTARKLGAATSFTATESAQGMLMLSRAGMSTMEVVAATGAVLDLAKVAAIGLQESATLTADSLKQFSMDANQARLAADILAHASNNANTDITQLGEGLKMAGPLAAAAGMSLADTSVVLGILADNGLKATLGGTGIRAMLASLGDPSDEAAAALQRLGIDTDTLTQKIQTKGGLREVMSKLGPDIMGMTDAIRIFSRRGAAAALIMGRSTKAWEKFDKKMESASGTVRTSAALIEQGLGDAFKQMGSAIEEAVHQLGDSGMSGGLKGVVHWLTDGIRALGDWSVGMTKATASAAAFMLVLAGGPAIAAVAAMSRALWAFVRGPMAAIKKHPIMMAVTAIMLLVEGIIALTDKARFSTKEMVDFNKTIKDMAVSTANLVDQWRTVMEVGGQAQFAKKAQLISSLQSQVTELLTKAIKVRDVGGKISSEQFAALAKAGDKFGLAGGVGIALRPRRATTMAGRAKGFFKEVDAAKVVEALKSLLLRLETLKGAQTQWAKTPGAAGQTQLQKDVAAAADARDRRKQALLLFTKAQAKEVELRRRETELLGASASERKAYMASENLLQAIMKKTGLTMDEARKKHGNLIGEYSQEIIATEKLLKKKKDLQVAEDKAVGRRDEQIASAEQHASELANAMINPLVEALQSGDWEHVGKTILAQLQAALITQHITKPLIAELIKAMPTGTPTEPKATALGAAYSGGIQRFARGGVVGSSTLFRTRGGLGIMGEAGPEAIMPLRRGPGGRLGVEAQGGGHVVNDNRTINIQVRDDAGFRRTMRQLDRDTTKRMETGFRQ